MAVYLINIFLILIWGLFLIYNKPTPSKKAYFCTIASFQWILISGLRSWSVGPDTYAYYLHFERVKKTGWDVLLRNIVNKYLHGADIKDPGYPLLTKLIQIFSGSYQFFLMFIAILFMMLMGRWIYKYSKDPCISFIIFSCLFYSFFAITGHRQTIATALVVFIGYEFIQKHKLLPYLILCLLAATVHISCLMFIPFYFLYDLKLTKKKLCVFCAIAFAIPTILSRLLVPIAALFNYDHYLGDDMFVGGTFTYTTLLTLILLAGLLLKDKMIKVNVRVNHFLNAVIWAVLFSLMTFVAQGFMRVQQYYALFIMLLIPEIVASLKKREQFLLNSFFVLVLLLLFIRKPVTYTFFF